MIALLTGAGFSKSHGGLLASELSSMIISSPHLSSGLRSSLLRSNNYEDVLGDLENDRGGENYKRMFAAMTDALFAQEGLISSHGYRSKSFVEFIQKAREYNQEAGFRTYVFTLNQDMLLERYESDEFPLVKPGVSRQTDRQLHGFTMNCSFQDRAFHVGNAELVDDAYDWKDNDSLDKIFYLKLHGSISSITGSLDEPKPILIAGRFKSDTIQQHSILQQYYEEFRSAIKKQPTDLIVIGYSFRDPHINRALVDAADAGLRLHIISPEPSAEWYSRLYAGVVDAEHPYCEPLLGLTRSYYQIPFHMAFSEDTVIHSKFAWRLWCSMSHRDGKMGEFEARLLRPEAFED